jgi:hypothetical protein
MHEAGPVVAFQLHAVLGSHTFPQSNRPKISEPAPELRLPTYQRNGSRSYPSQVFLTSGVLTECADVTKDGVELPPRVDLVILCWWSAVHWGNGAGYHGHRWSQWRGGEMWLPSQPYSHYARIGRRLEGAKRNGRFRCGVVGLPWPKCMETLDVGEELEGVYKYPVLSSRVRTQSHQRNSSYHRKTKTTKLFIQFPPFFARSKARTAFTPPSSIDQPSQVSQFYSLTRNPPAE